MRIKNYIKHCGQNTIILGMYTMAISGIENLKIIGFFKQEIELFFLCCNSWQKNCNSFLFYLRTQINFLNE